MDNKRVGVTIVLFSLLLGFILLNLFGRLDQSSVDHGCFPSEECAPIQTSLSVVHLAFGVFSFIFALGVYLIFFGRGEEAVLKRLEQDSQRQLVEEKFRILLMALDPYERKVVTLIRKEEGITQNMIPLRTNLSKAKVSYVINELERRNLIKRVAKKKTQAVYLQKLF